MTEYVPAPLAVRHDAPVTDGPEGSLTGLHTDAAGRLKVTSLPGTPSRFRLTTTASTNATVIKAAPGILTLVVTSNPTVTGAYLKVYDKATAPVVGTDVPVVTQTIQSAGGGAQPFVLNLAGGIPFSAGIAIAVTGGVTAGDATVSPAGLQIVAAYI